MVVQAAGLGVSLTLNFMQQLGQAVGMLARQYDVTVIIQWFRWLLLLIFLSSSVITLHS
jgi:hypothetical protein